MRSHRETGRLSHLRLELPCPERWGNELLNKTFVFQIVKLFKTTGGVLNA